MVEIINRPEYLFSLFGNLTKIDGIGPRTGANLSKVGVLKPLDFLYSIPTGIKVRKIAEFISEGELNNTVILKVTILKHNLKRFGIPSYVEAKSGAVKIKLVFFKAKSDWLLSTFPINEDRLVSGKLEKFNNEFQIIHPEYVVKVNELNSIPRVEALYGLTKGITQKMFCRSVKKVIAMLPNELNNYEWIEKTRLSSNGWGTFTESLCRIHTPKSVDDLLFSSPFRLRLAYDDLFSHQVSLALSRNKVRDVKKKRLPILENLSNLLITKLPFELTASQKKCVGEIKADLSSSKRMFRLLQGDVGSGKTLVAFITMLFAAENEGQCALMVPTDLLAQQHFKNLANYIGDLNVEVIILSGKMKPKIRKDKLERIRTGKAQIVVGTHALFQKDVKFKNLRLSIIDEQHRFGVKQRFDLINKGEDIDILVMTATPIPRTLQLSNYGDLDVSTIDQKPLNRKKINTAIISEAKIESLLTRLTSACLGGQQAYWVCPLIEDNEDLELVALERRFSVLKAYDPSLNVEILHGKIAEDQKIRIMNSFINGEIHVLLATTVIEVGVDVPNASIMIVEGAERFGLAQLHQLRGRVGRGDLPSSCTLVYSKNVSKSGKDRLEILRNNDNGFQIAEEDLKMRGGGDPLGLQQSGVPKFRLADLGVHSDILAWAQEDARKILTKNPDLKGTEGSNIRLLLFLMGREESLSLIRAS